MNPGEASRKIIEEALEEGIFKHHLHPRDREGKFKDVLSHLSSGGTAQSSPAGKRESRMTRVANALMGPDTKDPVEDAREQVAYDKYREKKAQNMLAQVARDRAQHADAPPSTPTQPTVPSTSRANSRHEVAAAIVAIERQMEREKDTQKLAGLRARRKGLRKRLGEMESERW